jgi:hypothetical protein
VEFTATQIIVVPENTFDPQVFEIFEARKPPKAFASLPFL